MMSKVPSNKRHDPFLRLIKGILAVFSYAMFFTIIDSWRRGWPPLSALFVVLYGSFVIGCLMLILIKRVYQRYFYREHLEDDEEIKEYIEEWSKNMPGSDH